MVASLSAHVHRHIYAVVEIAARASHPALDPLVEVDVPVPRSAATPLLPEIAVPPLNCRRALLDIEAVSDDARRWPDVFVPVREGTC